MSKFKTQRATLFLASLALLAPWRLTGCAANQPRISVPAGGESNPSAALPPATTSQPSQAGRVGDETTQNTGQIVAETDATANVAISSAVGVGVIALVSVVLAALGLMLGLLFGVVRMIVRQSHERAIRRLEIERLTIGKAGCRLVP